jgi:hypothetical protein
MCSEAMGIYKSCSCRYPNLTRNGYCVKCEKLFIPLTDVIKTCTQKILDVQILRDYYDFTDADYVMIEIEIEKTLWNELEKEGIPKLPMSKCFEFYKKKALAVTQDIIYKVLRHMTEEEYAHIRGRNPPLRFWNHPVCVWCNSKPV